MGFEEKEHVKSFVCLTMWAPKESFRETNSRAGGGGGVSPHYNNLASLDCFRSFLHMGTPTSQLPHRVSKRIQFYNLWRDYKAHFLVGNFEVCPRERLHMSADSPWPLEGGYTGALSSKTELCSDFFVPKGSSQLDVDALFTLLYYNYLFL